MERRVLRCCAENKVSEETCDEIAHANCPLYDECQREYDRFVNQKDVPVRSELARQNAIETQKRNYHKLRKAGIGSKVASRNLTNRRTEQLLRLSGDGHG